MKRYFFLALLPLLFSGCWTARIVTVAPDPVVRTYSTSVTIPKAHTVTTTRVVAADDDISLYLDLQAIGAAFAQSSNVQEFEQLINNSSYMLSNLDLNRDGYVDYLRVMETVQGHAHVFVIQAVLANNIFQDVASVVAEVPSVSTFRIQVVGDPFIYGPKYILEPVFVARPLICSYLLRASYTPWRSPWYWGHFPSHYKHPVPIYISHYHAYVDTYLRNHRYCNRVNYVDVCHFADYHIISAPDRRNDYGRQHPERDFVTRTASLPAVRSTESNATVNARNIREAYDAGNVRTSTPTTRSAASTANARANSSTKTGTTVRSASTSTSSTPRTVTATNSTTGSRSTSTATVTSGSSPRTVTATGNTSSSASRSAATTTATSSTPRSVSTTVKSNVRTSGSSTTSIRTTSPSGKETTTNRTSSTSTRSASPTSTGTRSTTVSSSSNRSSSTTATPRNSSSGTTSARGTATTTTGRR